MGQHTAADFHALIRRPQRSGLPRQSRSLLDQIDRRRYTAPMPKIRQLPPQLVNQIAAGEVIERPASVVKELMENSVDAGARRIEVAIQGGGSELIRVSDDGCGMTAEQLPLAIASHATSKLPDEQALFHVGTLGFRGEAMASIASVSQLTIRSRVDSEPGGAEIAVRGGEVEPPGPCGCPVGTVVEVRNLFFNTPVRRKFLRTAQTENGHITEAFTRLALAYPAVHMVLRHGQRVLHDLPPTDHWGQRISAFFGSEIGGALLRIDSGDGELSVSGYVCDPSVSRGNSRMQYLFLNGRHIRDRALQHALGEAYRGLLMVGRHPICFLRLDMPPELVDVNVHPTKLEVRFTDSGRVYARLLQTLRHHFLTSDMTMRVGPPEPGRVDDAHDQPAPSDAAGTPAWSSTAQMAHRQAVIDWAKNPRGAAPATAVPDFRPFPSNDATMAPWDIGSPASEPVATAAPTAQAASTDAPDEPAPTSQSPPAALPSTSPEPAQTPPSTPTVCHLGFQVHQRYLVTQDEAGMVVIDQHALHERVMYERLKQKVFGEGEPVESQRLLVPEPVSLTPAERSAALDARELLQQVGILIDPFGGDTILISAYPAMLRRSNPGDVLREALESILAAGKDPEAQDLLDKLLHCMACKAAVKAGDRLTAEEITSLLEQRHLYHDTHHCPHGRPTALFFNRDELDRMFGRLGPRGRASAAPSSKRPQET